MESADFVYVMALYNTKLARWRYLLSQCDTNWASDVTIYSGVILYSSVLVLKI